MKIIRIKQTGASEDDVRQLEGRLGTSLPEDYRSFLLQYDGGKPEPSVFHYHSISQNYTDSRVDRFFPVSGASADTINRHLYTYAGRIASRMLPIADDPFGNIICISTLGPDYGCIYFWDHEQELSGQAECNLYLIAESFTAFLNGLTDEEDMLSDPPWLQAICRSDLDDLRKILDEGLDVQTAHEGGTPIQYAVARNEISITMELISRGARPDGCFGTAASQGYVELMTYLVQFGPTQSELQEALFLELVYAHPQLVRELCEHGADVSVEKRGVAKNTPLHCAAAAGNAQSIRILLAHGARTGVKDAIGRTALHYAVAHEDLQVAEELLRAGEDAQAEDIGGWTPLKLIQGQNRRKSLVELSQRVRGANQEHE